MCSVTATLWDLMNCSRQAPLYRIFRQEYGMEFSIFLLQGIFRTRDLSRHLLHWQADSVPLCHLESQLKTSISYWLNLHSKITTEMEFAFNMSIASTLGDCLLYIFWYISYWVMRVLICSISSMNIIQYFFANWSLLPRLSFMNDFFIYILNINISCWFCTFWS